MFIDTMAATTELLAELAARGVEPSRLRLTIDIGHLHCQGELPIPAKIRQSADRLANVHIEDMRAGVHEHLMFGEGEIDFPPVIAALAEIGYAGLVSVELSRHSHEGPEAARRAYNFLRPLVAAASSARTKTHNTDILWTSPAWRPATPLFHRELNGQIRRFAFDSRPSGSRPVLDAEPVAPVRRRRPRDARPQLSGRHLPGAGQHDDRQLAPRARRRRQRLLLARPAARRDVDRLERLHPAAADLGHPPRPRSRDHFGRLVPAPQQGLRRRLHLHARPGPQPRRQRIALVLHPTRMLLRRAEDEARPFPAATFLGTARRNPVDGLDRRLGGHGGRKIQAQLLLHLLAAPRLRRPERPAPTARPPSKPSSSSTPKSAS